MAGDEDIVITPAIRRYLAAFEASLRDGSPGALERREEALRELRAAPPPRRTRAMLPLSPRQTQVLRLRAAGMSEAAVGGLLEISPKTVNRHMCGVHAKAGTSNPFLLMEWAIRRGLVRVGAARTEP